jgi:hypothetical protein
LLTSIKNLILGKDSEKNEYWYFKEDQHKLFVKKFDKPPMPEEEEGIEKSQAMVVDEQIHMAIAEPRFEWFYYETEEDFSKLLEACNVKGIRERKLRENLQRIGDKMKLKKSKAKKAAPTGEKEEDKENVEMKADGEEEVAMVEASQESKQNQKHYVFETDDYYQALINAVWHGRKMPTKRQVSMEQRGRTTTRKLMGLQVTVP